MKSGPKEDQVRALRERRAANQMLLPAKRAAVAKRIVDGMPPKTETAAQAASPAGPKPAPKNGESAMTKSAKKVAKKSRAKKPAGKKGARRGASKTARSSARKAVDVREGSKLADVAQLLLRPEGCTTAEVLKTTGWPTVSMPQQAKAAGLKLRKDKKPGEVTHYFGTPLAKAAAAAPAAAE